MKKKKSPKEELMEQLDEALFANDQEKFVFLTSQLDELEKSS